MEVRGTRPATDAYDDDYLGDQIIKKESNMLRIVFQNIGGFNLNKNKLKDDTIRHSIQKWEIDILHLQLINGAVLLSSALIKQRT